MQGRTVVLEAEEKRALTLLQQMRALNKDKVARRHEKQEIRRGEHRKKVAEDEMKKAEKRRQERKERIRELGMKQKRDADTGDEKRIKKRKQSYDLHLRTLFLCLLV